MILVPRSVRVYFATAPTMRMSFEGLSNAVREVLRRDPLAGHIFVFLNRRTPGTNLLAFCTAAGWTSRRWLGAIVALLASSIPCSLLVVLNALIGTDGSVKEVTPARPADPALEAAASAAVREWQFTPTYLNCVPIEVRMKVTVRFEPGA